MKNKRYSLYLTLGIIIFTTVVVIMTINSAYSYINTKNMIIEKMKKDSQTTILSIKDNVQSLMATLSVDEYNSIVKNEISRKDIFSIVIQDYNMGKMLGQKSLVSGKIKYASNNIVDYDPTNDLQNTQLENCFYWESYNINDSKNRVIGKISIYISDKKMNDELDHIIVSNIKNTIFLSTFLIIFLFLTIRIFLLKPISDMIRTIEIVDNDGIPTKAISNHSIIEINKLSYSINKMIESIRRSRRSLKKEQNQLEYLLESSPIAVRITKREKVIFANKAYSKILRMDNKSPININPKQYYLEEKTYEEIKEKLKKNENIFNRLVKLYIDNKNIWALASYMNINFDGQEATIGWFYDVTNEKNNENKLFEALDLQSTLFDNSGYLIIRTDKKGVIEQVNKESEKLLGYKSHELIGKTPDIFHLEEEILSKKEELEKELNIQVCNLLETFVIKSNMNLENEYEWTFVTKEGGHIPVLLSISALRNKRNEIYGYLGIAKDISENKAMQSQAKLASMGEMIGNIAHQWRQPLSVISTIASGIKVKKEFNILDEEELVHEMQSITEQTQYLSRTIDDFRNFIKDKDTKEKFSISTLIDKTLSIVKSSMKNNDVEVIINEEEDILIKGYQNQLIQALINILNNSKDAHKESQEDKKMVFIKTYFCENDFVLSIKDNAGGIKTDIIEKIFDPYFTTKHQSIGTGIGLSMSYQIITEHHNATIKASNSTYDYEGQNYTGACFEIRFKDAYI